MTNGAWTVPANIVPVDEESPRKGIKILVGAAGRPSAAFSTRACPRWQAVISVDTCLGGPWTPRVGRPVRQTGHGGSWPRS